MHHQVPPPLAAQHSDFRARLRNNLPHTCPWVLCGINQQASGAAAAQEQKQEEGVIEEGKEEEEEALLGSVLLAVAVRYDSLRFVQGLAAAIGGDVLRAAPALLRIGGRSLAHVACEAKSPAALAWLLDAARRLRRLPELLGSQDCQGGRRPLEVAVDAGFGMGLRLCLEAAWDHYACNPHLSTAPGDCHRQQQQKQLLSHSDG